MDVAKLLLFLGLLLALLPLVHSASPPRMDKDSNKTPPIRLYLIRHGETLANIQRVVVGQLDSPLTKLGMRQAAALGNSSMVKDVKFWRRYSSDLQRTQKTAHLVDSHHHFTLDERLREIAKGARQGLPKSYTIDQCMEYFKDRPEEIPKHESSDEAWKRLSSFLVQLLQEAGDDDKTDEDDETANKTRNVLVISHSGTLRLLLHKLVPDAHPLLQDSADTSGALEDSKRFQIPNTSLTILDIKSRTESNSLGPQLRAKLIMLNWIDHFSSL